VVCSTVRDLVPWYVSLTTAVVGPTFDPRSFGPTSCDESLTMRAWLRFGCGNLGIQVDCTVCKYIFSLKLKWHGGSLNHPKRNTDGGRNDTTNVSRADLSPTLVPRFIPESPHHYFSVRPIRPSGLRFRPIHVLHPETAKRSSTLHPCFVGRKHDPLIARSSSSRPCHHSGSRSGGCERGSTCIARAAFAPDVSRFAK
jgi:hypothetical protein